MFCQEIKDYKQKGHSLIYVDESGFSKSQPRTHGYSVQGKRCYGKHNWGEKGRTNVIGALLAGALLTVSLFETTINTDIFTAWIKQDLLPKLPQSSVVIMDNAAFHKNQSIKKALHNAGHILLFLPPYSPDLNEIEHKWGEAKSKRRKTQLPIHDLFQLQCL